MILYLLVNKFFDFKESEISFAYSHKAATGPYPEA